MAATPGGPSTCRYRDPAGIANLPPRLGSFTFLGWLLALRPPFADAAANGNSGDSEDLSVEERQSGNAARRMLCIGECMVELARGTDARFGLALGGDSFNTAVYLARSGVSTRYLTALGDDAYSQEILDLAAAENVDTGGVARLPGRVLGLYLIETDARGERTFYYWRDTSPAREVFSGAVAASVKEALAQAELIYFSGITLWLYSRDGLEPFFNAISEARRNGARIAFDSNYRKRLWGAAPEPARKAFASAIALADIALPSLDDERLPFDAREAAGIEEEILGRLTGEQLRVRWRMIERCRVDAVVELQPMSDVPRIGGSHRNAAGRGGGGAHRQPAVERAQYRELAVDRRADTKRHA